MLNGQLVLTHIPMYQVNYIGHEQNTYWFNSSMNEMKTRQDSMPYHTQYT